MKRIALLVVVGSFLGLPAAFAQDVPQSVPPPSATPPEASPKESDFFEPLIRGTSDEVNGAFQGTDSPELDNGRPGAVEGSFEGTDRLDVRGYFPEIDSGS